MQHSPRRRQGVNTLLEFGIGPADVLVAHDERIVRAPFDSGLIQRLADRFKSQRRGVQPLYETGCHCSPLVMRSVRRCKGRRTRSARLLEAAEAGQCCTHSLVQGRVGLGFEESGLEAGGHGNPDGYVAIVVVVVGEHYVDFFPDEEGWFAVGLFFFGLREGGTEAADSSQVFFAGDRRMFGGLLDFFRGFFCTSTHETTLFTDYGWG